MLLVLFYNILFYVEKVYYKRFFHWYLELDLYRCLSRIVIRMCLKRAAVLF